MITKDTPQFKTFLKLCQQIRDSHELFQNETPLDYKVNKKYIHIFKTKDGKPSSSHCLVNRETGDIHYPAGWARALPSPTRGNIFDESPARMITPYGPQNLR